jgi:hypothetical protein
MLNLANLDRLIAHLEGVPEENFSMQHLAVDRAGCGTVACIAGWCNIIRDNYWDAAPQAADWLGIEDWGPLFCPDGYLRSPEIYPLSRAIRTLKHMRSEYLRTGEIVVDWDTPEPVALKPWTAPKAVELKADLPAEITRFLGSPLATSEVL